MCLFFKKRNQIRFVYLLPELYLVEMKTGNRGAGRGRLETKAPGRLRFNRFVNCFTAHLCSVLYCLEV